MIGLEDLKLLVMKMELADIPGVLTSGLLNSIKMRPMGRRFSIKIIEYIIEHFGSEFTIPYLGNIINFLIEGCKDSEVHVQNSAISTIGLISKSYLTEEIFQLNPEIINIFFDPLIQFLKKENNPSIQISAIAAVSSAIDGMGVNLTIMNLNKFMNNLVPIMVNPSISEACRAVVIDSLRKIVVLVWTFLQETPFGSSPNMYDFKVKQFNNEKITKDNLKLEDRIIDEDFLTPPITWKYLFSIFNGIIKELYPNYTNNNKNSNVRSASLSLLTEIMICCFVAQAGALLAAHNTNIPLKKPIDGIKSCAQITINAIDSGTKDKSPKVRDVAQYCMKRLQEANEAYIPDSQDLVYFSQNIQIAEKEQKNDQNTNRKIKHRNRTINEEFFKNATDEIIIKHVSPPYNWKATEVQNELLSDNYIEEPVNYQKVDSSEEENIQNNEKYLQISKNTTNEDVDAKNNFNLISNSRDLVKTQHVNNISDANSNENKSLQNFEDSSESSIQSLNNNSFLLNRSFVTNTTSTPLPSPLYIVAQPPIIHGQIIACSETNQATNLQRKSQSEFDVNEKQFTLEKKVEELTKELKKLTLRQSELENVAHVLKMVAIHRVDSLEKKIKNLLVSLDGTTKDENNKHSDIIDERKSLEFDLVSSSTEQKKETIDNFRKELYEKAKQIIVENKQTI